VSRPHQPIHLLVIDDDVSVRELLVEYLATRGYRVDGTSDGRIALELMRSSRYDLVLTDYQIPHRDGLDILRVARQMSPPMPTILMTGYGTVDTAVAALKEGASDFLLKPFKLKGIHQAIQQALERARQSQADARLMSTVSLYDFAGSVRDRWQLMLLFRQIATRLATELERCEAGLVVRTSKGTGWERISSRSDPDLTPLFDHLDAEQLFDELQPDQTTVDDEPSHRFPELPEGASAPTWLAARSFAISLGGGESQLAGAVVAFAHEADPWATELCQQSLARFASLAGNVATRVHLLDPPSGEPTR
jgi:FixJ family two-component response regulator